MSNKKPLKLTLNGKELDLSNAVPLTIGDIRHLKKLGYDVLKMDTANLEVDQIVGLLKYVCNKVDPSVTDEDIESMPLPWMNALSKVMYAMNEDDLPF